MRGNANRTVQETALVLVMIEALRRGITKRADCIRFALDRHQAKPDEPLSRLGWRVDRALRAARSEGFEAVGPVSTQDGSGALVYYAAEVLRLYEDARAAGNHAAALIYLDRWLLAHGVRIESDVQTATLGPGGVTLSRTQSTAGIGGGAVPPDEMIFLASIAPEARRQYLAWREGRLLAPALPLTQAPPVANLENGENDARCTRANPQTDPLAVADPDAEPGD